MNKLSGRMLSVFLVFAFLVSSYAPITAGRAAGAALPTIRLNAPAEPQPNTGAIDIPVTISGAVNLGAFEFDLVYDHALVQVVGISLGDFLGKTTNCDASSSRCAVVLGPLAQGNAAGMGAYSYGTGPGKSGEGTLAVIHLKGAGKGGTAVLGLANPLITSAGALPSTPATQGASLVLQGGTSLYLPFVLNKTTR